MSLYIAYRSRPAVSHYSTLCALRHCLARPVNLLHSSSDQRSPYSKQFESSKSLLEERRRRELYVFRTVINLLQYLSPVLLTVNKRCRVTLPPPGSNVDRKEVFLYARMSAHYFSQTSVPNRRYSVVNNHV